MKPKYKFENQLIFIFLNGIKNRDYGKSQTKLLEIEIIEYQNYSKYTTELLEIYNETWTLQPTLQNSYPLGDSPVESSEYWRRKLGSQSPMAVGNVAAKNRPINLGFNSIKSFYFQ